MIFRKYFFYILFLCFLFSEAKSQTISEIKFFGLKRTKYSYLEKNVIKSKVGQNVDSALLKKDVQEMINLKHFSFVNFVIVNSDSVKNLAEVHFFFIENFSLLPNFDIGFSQNNFRIQGGIVDYNALGRSGSMNLYLRYQGRTTYFYNGDYPFLLGGKKGLAVDLYKNATFEPFFYNSKKLEYNYDLYAAIIYFRYDFNSRNYLKIGTGYQYENYNPRITDTIVSESPLNGKADRLFLRLNYKYLRVNIRREQSEGFSFEFYCNKIFSNAPKQVGIYSNNLSGSSLKFFSEIRGYVIPYRTGNTAIRLRAGLTKAPLFDQFVLDDIVNIRGIGFRMVRREYEFVVNLEHRQTVFGNKYGALQLVGFADYTPGFQYMGGGVRLYIEKLHGMILRMDYGVNTQQTNQGGIVAGIYQYF